MIWFGVEGALFQKACRIIIVCGAHSILAGLSGNNTFARVDTMRGICVTTMLAPGYARRTPGRAARKVLDSERLMAPAAFGNVFDTF